MLLVFLQIGLLGFSIYGYIKKLSFTKYISVVTSVLIILTLDVFDIIIGALYFLFSIDQNFLTKLINKIKNLKRS